MTDRVRDLSAELLSDNWGKLHRYSFGYRRSDGTWQDQVREVYDRGDGAACLLHDPVADTILLVRQFRLPMHVSGKESFLVEVPAGVLDGAAPEARWRAELMEETGYEVGPLTHVTDLIMSPGSVTEALALFLGTYTRGEASGAGGGHDAEGEDIEVLHIPLDEALAQIAKGELRDAKTVCLIQHLALRFGRRLPDV